MNNLHNTLGDDAFDIGIYLVLLVVVELVV
jgi:hypothetical protein